MLMKQGHPIIAAVGSNLFVVYNTYNGLEANITMQHYNTKGGEWSYKSQLPAAITGTSGASAVAVAKDVYIVGGEEKICARYNTDTDAWTGLSSPMLDHSYGSAVFHNNTIYLCGGGPYSSSHNIIEEYDIVNDTWQVSDFKLPVEVKYHTVAMTSLF